MSSYKAIAASTTGGSLAGAGQTGKKGDVVRGLIITAITAATATVTLIDGSTSIVITAANTPIGVYSISLGDQGLVSQTGAWTITTGAGASVIAIGDFGGN